MKRILVCVAVIMLVLSGCGGREDGLKRVLSFREKLLTAECCRFISVIEADYGERIYTFTMSCQADRNGEFSFEVKEPDTIASISGTVNASGGKVIFEETVLAFPLLADGEITPVSAPWLLTRTLQRGYIDTVGTENDLLRATFYDNYEEGALQLDIWFASGDTPVQAEILWQGRRILTVKIENFEIL